MKIIMKRALNKALNNRGLYDLLNDRPGRRPPVVDPTPEEYAAAATLLILVGHL